MSTSLRIEELKKKFDENPRRYFAPLANEYRKAGDLQQAIAICQAHLPQQPGHMSGHIVYGQALFEARQFDQARTVFETALALDPENLIALRYLGDIAFELGDRGGARGWYTRVLETDPRNEEIAALMAAIGDERAPSRETAPPAPAEASVAAAGAPAPSAAATKEPDAARAAPESPRGVAPPPSSADAELEKLFARPAGPPPTSAPPQTGSFSPLSAFGGAKEAPPSLEQPAPSLSGDALARPTFDAQRGDDTPLQKPPRESTAAPAGASQTPAAPSAPGGAGFVTETMAQLYVKQGFHDRALSVYRELVAQNPGDRALRERMERIERELRGGAARRDVGFGAAARPTVRQFLATIGSRGLTGRGPGVAPPPGSGPRTSGEFRVSPERPARTAAAGSIDALFAGSAPSREDVAAASTLADAFPTGGSGAASPDASIGGRPAHPATTELSLDHVFRDGGNVGSGRTSAGVSYDQFFSQPAEGSGTSSDDAAPGGTPASGADDIEQFNAWLQGLKKR